MLLFIRVLIDVDPVKKKVALQSFLENITRAMLVRRLLPRVNNHGCILLKKEIRSINVTNKIEEAVTLAWLHLPDDIIFT